jgi:O-glycosyl hydrolase
MRETAKGIISLYETSLSGDRFKGSQLKFGSNESLMTDKSQTIKIDRSKKFQKIIGFGGAFTGLFQFVTKAHKFNL